MGCPQGPPPAMTAIKRSKSIGAAIPLTLRLWSLPLITSLMIFANLFWAGLNGAHMTMIAAMAIVIFGIPHGTLDAEIAATYFGRNDIAGKAKIIAAYIGCALAMSLFWAVTPEFALTSFLIISIIHFSRDWRGGVDPFLAMMVGWALVALPALAHPAEVAAIFKMLTGNPNGAIIAALLACASAPALLGSLVFAYWAFANDDKQSAVEVIACVVAALFLPPLIAFAIFFCGLHSPRHMADALRQTGTLSSVNKFVIVAAVSALSLGLGVLIYASGNALGFDAGIVRSAFVLISTLTVPHFILERLIAKD